MKVSLCLIVFNELEGCQRDVPHLPQDEFDEIYAVDGGSRDGTKEYLQSKQIPVYQQAQKGLNAAYIEANARSSCDAVVAFFPKGTLPVEDLRQFRPLFEQGNQLVIASRQINGSTNEEDVGLWRPRKWAVMILALIVGIIWRREGWWVRDVLHGFKGWERRAFERMKIVEHGLSIDLEMVIRAYKFHMKRVEFPTVEKTRHYGDSHFKFWPTGKKLLAYCWFELRRED